MKSIAETLKTLLTGVVMAFGIFAFLPGFASAYFFDEERSEANAFEASQLDLLESSSYNNKQALTNLEMSAGSLGATYEASGAVSSSTANFCGDIVVTVEQNDVQVFEGNPADFTASGALGASGQDKFDYEFTTNIANGSYGDETCTVSFYFQASQENFEYGEAFHDREEASFTLIGANFTTEDADDTPAPSASESGGNLEISEIMFDLGEDADGSASDENREWVEVQNGSTSDIDLTSWKLRENETNHGISSHNRSKTVKSGGFAIIADDAETFVAEHPEVTVPVFDSSFSLNNSSETLVLKSPEDKAVDTKSYDESQETGNGDSVQFVGGNACVAPETAGVENACEPAPASFSQSQNQSATEKPSEPGDQLALLDEKGTSTSEEENKNASTTKASTSAKKVSDDGGDKEKTVEQVEDEDEPEEKSEEGTENDEDVEATSDDGGEKESPSSEEVDDEMKAPSE